MERETREKICQANSTSDPAFCSVVEKRVDLVSSGRRCYEKVLQPLCATIDCKFDAQHEECAQTTRPLNVSTLPASKIRGHLSCQIIVISTFRERGIWRIFREKREQSEQFSKNRWRLWNFHRFVLFFIFLILSILSNFVLHFVKLCPFGSIFVHFVQFFTGKMRLF